MGEVVNWLESQSPENSEPELPKLAMRYARDKKLTESQLAALHEMAVLYASYADSEMNLKALKSIYYLLQHPEKEAHILKSKRPGKSLSIFEEDIPLGELVKSILFWVKNRVKNFSTNPPKYKTVILDNSNVDEQQKTKFELDAADLQKVRMNFAKREKTSRSKSNNSKSINGKGRIIGYSAYPSGNIAVMSTILKAITGGAYSLETQIFNINNKHFTFPRYESNIVYNIMLVLDTSKSISWVIPHIEKFISHISASVENSRDKLGLITFNDDLAQIYHYPTLNVKQVIGTINKMEAKGNTPLGDGLNLALQVFGREKYRQPGEKNLVILISDCFPEPLEGGHKNLLDEPAYKKVISAAEKLMNEKLGFIIINPAPNDKGKNNWGQKLIKKVMEVSNAKLIDLPPVISYSIIGTQNDNVTEEKLTELYTAVCDVKLNIS